MSESLSCHIDRWCQDNGWTDLFVEQYQYWAFPPGAVMPIPVPVHVFEGFHTSRSLPLQEKIGYTVSVGVTLLAIFLSCSIHSPMPLVGAFCFCAVIIALLEEDAT